MSSVAVQIIPRRCLHCHQDVQVIYRVHVDPTQEPIRLYALPTALHAPLLQALDRLHTLHPSLPVSPLRTTTTSHGEMLVACCPHCHRALACSQYDETLTPILPQVLLLPAPDHPEQPERAPSFPTDLPPHQALSGPLFPP